MPSLTPGFQSGGQPLTSGNPFSGNPIPIGGVLFKVSAVVSGLVYVGATQNLASGGVTITSGGALSSGGMADGVELKNGDEYFMPVAVCGRDVSNIKIVVPAAVSGTMRVFWEAR